MTVSATTTTKKIPPYLPVKHSYSPTHPTQFLIDFGEGDYNSSLRTTRAFSKGETIATITNTLPGIKAYSSVQVLPDPPIAGSTQDLNEPRHIELNSDLLYVNHSCDPNVAFDVRPPQSAWHVRALKDITLGEILTFAYFSTEWDMDQPFQCLCQSSQCLGTIRGAKDIDAEILSRYFVNDHIVAMKSQQKKENVAGGVGKVGTKVESGKTVEVVA